MTDDGKDELERLRTQLKEMTAERDRLLAENRRSLSGAEHPQEYILASPKEFTSTTIGIPLNTEMSSLTILPKVNNESPLSEKVHLFRSLFHGREDVFAKLWQNRQSGKVGYSPVCSHEWDSILCGKPRVKCGNCPNRSLVPMTDNVIQDHLKGKHTIGIYPLLPDGNCYLLAIDFDKHSWLEDAAAFLETCHRMHILAAIERSRSGIGAHVWIFFSEAVRASAARKFGCYLLTETMSQRHQLGMDSYDRLFPNQDTVPKGGFGNLIALPLQKEPAEKDNTLFLNSSFRAYQDQWAFLASLDRVKPSVLNEMIRVATRNEQVMGIRTSSFDDEDQPWITTTSKQLRVPLLDGSFPSKVKMVMSNLIYVEKNGIPSPLLNQIKRLAAFQNPEFYKKQKLRLSTFLTPRVISCAEDFPKYLGIPRGCLNELQELLESAGIQPEVVDKCFPGKEINVTFHGQLTSAQKEAASDLIRHDNGVLVAPSGSGKTVVGIYTIAVRKINTLVLVHRRPLLEQWRAQLANFLEVDTTNIGQIGGGKDRHSGFIDVAMLQSLIKKGRVENLVTEYGQIIVDECHHLPAVTFEQVLRQIRARYIVGLTATPYRRDGHQPIILMQCGPIRHVISQKDQKAQRLLQHSLICRDTSFTLPSQESELSIHDIYALLVADEERNKLILGDLLQALEEGRSPILLTERRDHLEYFANALIKLVPNVVVLHGGMGSRQRNAIKEQLASIPTSAKRVLLATGRYIGEGFDDARLDTLFLAMPVSWKGTLVQYAGRLHRLHAGKTEVKIYDYVDRSNPALLRMFQRRLRGYRTIGYEPDSVDSSPKKLLNS